LDNICYVIFLVFPIVLSISRFYKLLLLLFHSICIRQQIIR